MKPYRETKLGKPVIVGSRYCSTRKEPESETEVKDMTAPAPATDEELEEMSICTPEDMERALESATPEMQALLRARPRSKSRREQRGGSERD